MAKYIHNEHQVSLTSDEVYTLLLLLGKVAGDDESYDIFEKLLPLIDRGLGSEDFERVRFVGETESEDWGIKIEEGEKE